MDIVEIYIGNQKIDLEPSEVIALSYKIAKIGEIQFVQADASNRITAPYTRNNRNIFDNAEQVNNQTTFPYVYQDVKIKQNGVWIEQRGKLVLEEFERDYKFSIYSGNVNLFDELSNLTLQDLTLTSLWHRWQESTISVNAGNDVADGFTYAVVDFGDLANTDQASEVNTQYLHPSFYYKYLVDQIFSQYSTFTFESDILTDTLYNTKLVIPFSDKDGWTVKDRSVGGNDVTLGWSGTQSFTDGTTDKLTQFTIPSNGTFNQFEIINDRYNVVRFFRFDVTAEVTYSNKSGANFFSVYENDDTLLSGLLAEEAFEAGASGTQTFTFTDLILSPDVTWFSFYRRGTLLGDTLDIDDLTLTITAKGGEILEGMTVVIEDVLPEIELFEFIKQLGFIFNAVFQSNTIQQTITLRKLDEIGNNKVNAVDWSSKVDFNISPKIEYTLDEFAQNNRLRYAEDDAVQANIGDGNIQISNTTLETENDYIETIYAASESDFYFGLETLAKVIIYDPSTLERDQSAEQRLLYVDPPALSPALSLTFQGSDSSSSVTNYKVGKFIDPSSSNNLAFSDTLINDHYQTLKSILESKIKKVTVYIRLNELDIESLDFFKPVYLNVTDARTGIAINGFFYIDEVIDFQTGQSTEVELVKLP